MPTQSTIKRKSATAMFAHMFLVGMVDNWPAWRLSLLMSFELTRMLKRFSAIVALPITHRPAMLDLDNTVIVIFQMADQANEYKARVSHLCQKIYRSRT